MMRSTSLARTAPLRRGKALQRKAPINRKRSRRVAGKTAADGDYTAWIHTQPCAGRALFLSYPVHRCAGPIEQAHARNLDGMTGFGRKEADRNSIPLCRALHREFDEHRGWFFGWSKERRREWMVERIVEANGRYDAEIAVAGGAV